MAHWGRDQMATILHTTFSSAFSQKNLQISLKISLKFVPEFPIYKKYISIDSDNGLAPAIDGLFTVA